MIDFKILGMFQFHGAQKIILNPNMNIQGGPIPQAPRKKFNCLTLEAPIMINFKEHDICVFSWKNRSSYREILACISSNVKQRNAREDFCLVSTGPVNFFFPNFFFVSDQQKPQNPSPQSLTLLSIFSQIIILRKSSEAFQNHNAISFPKISLPSHGNKLSSQNLVSKLKIEEKFT